MRRPVRVRSGEYLGTKTEALSAHRSQRLRRPIDSGCHRDRVHSATDSFGDFWAHPSTSSPSPRPARPGWAEPPLNPSPQHPPFAEGPSQPTCLRSTWLRTCPHEEEVPHALQSLSGNSPCPDTSNPGGQTICSVPRSSASRMTASARRASHEVPTDSRNSLHTADVFAPCRTTDIAAAPRGGSATWSVSLPARCRCVDGGEYEGSRPRRQLRARRSGTARREGRRSPRVGVTGDRAPLTEMPSRTASPRLQEHRRPGCRLTVKGTGDARR